MNIDTQYGAGVISSTHLVAFQEAGQSLLTRTKESISFTRSRKRKLSLPVEDCNNTREYVSNVEPPKFDVIECKTPFDKLLFTSLHFIWFYLRKVNSYDQILSNLPAWLLQNRMKKSNTKYSANKNKRNLFASNHF